MKVLGWTFLNAVYIPPVIRPVCIHHIQKQLLLYLFANVSTLPTGPFSTNPNFVQGTDDSQYIIPQCERAVLSVLLWVPSSRSIFMCLAALIFILSFRYQSSFASFATSLSRKNTVPIKKLWTLRIYRYCLLLRYHWQKPYPVLAQFVPVLLVPFLRYRQMKKSADGSVCFF